jgi:putative ABC transport system permease protein
MAYYRNKTKYSGIKRFWSNFKTSGFLAYKSVIRGNRWILVMIIMVMAFSFINLVFVSSILSGVMKTLDDQLIDTLYANVIIDPLEDDYYLEKVDRMESRIMQIEGVSGISPRLNSSGFIEYRWKEKTSQSDKGISGTWEVIGIDPEKEAGVTIIPDSIIEGSYLEPDDRDQILLGIEITGNEGASTSDFLTLGGVEIGDKVRVTYPNGVQREYTVKGIFRVREMMRADHQAFVTRTEMASALGRTVFSERASQILIKTDPGFSEAQIVRDIESLGINGEIRTWEEYGSGMRGIVSTFDIIAGLIGVIGLVVAAVIMFIVIYIGVVNRKKQIGILRAIGIPQNAIVGSYLIQSILYIGAGIVVGWLLFRFVILQYFMAYPLDLPIGLVSLTLKSGALGGWIFGLMIAGVLAGLVPALTVMRESIIKSIWGT